MIFTIRSFLAFVSLTVTAAQDHSDITAWLKAEKTLNPPDVIESGYLPVENVRFGHLKPGAIIPRHDQLGINGFKSNKWWGNPQQPVLIGEYNSSDKSKPSITWTNNKGKNHLRILIGVLDESGKGSTGKERLAIYHNNFKIASVNIGGKSELQYAYPYCFSRAKEEGRLGLECQFEPVRRIFAYGFVTKERRYLEQGDTIKVEAENPGSYSIFQVAFVPRTDSIEMMNPEILYAEAKYWEKRGLQFAWVTRMPSRCILIYGRSKQDVQKLSDKCFREKIYAENHQYYAPLNLKPGQKVYYRILAETNDGRRLASKEYCYVHPAIGRQVKSRVIPINPISAVPAVASPAFSSIPLSKGELVELGKVRLLENGKPLFAQFESISSYPDCSTRVLGANFTALPGRKYAVEFGPEIVPPKESGLVLSRNNDEIIIRDDNNAEWRFSKNHSAGLGKGFPVPWKLYQTAGDGSVLTASNPEVLKIEESGPKHMVIKVQGHFRNKSKKLYQYIVRWHVYPGKSSLDMELTVGNDIPNPPDDIKKVAYFKNIYFEYEQPVNEVEIAVDGKLKPFTGNDIDVFQKDEAVIRSSGRETKNHLTGLIVSGSGDNQIAARVENCWQQYPKSFEKKGKTIKVGLMPDYKESDYKFGVTKPYIKLYFYLRHGLYRFMYGVQKTHRLSFAFGENAKLQSGKQKPLMSRVMFVPPAKEMCQSEAFGKLRASDGRYKLIDKVSRDSLAKIFAARKRNREFGLLNFGDWFGERKINWGNLEYDLGQGCAQEFVRTGRDIWFETGLQAVTHQTDVDQVHYGKNLGLQVMHATCHTGVEYLLEDKINPKKIKTLFKGYSSPYPQVFHAGHAWCSGISYMAALTGYHRLRNMLNQFAEVRASQATVIMPPDQTHRGWNLLALTNAYAFSGNPFYLNGARIYFDRYKSIINPLEGATYSAGSEHETIGLIHRMALMRFAQVSGDPKALELLKYSMQGLYAMWDEDYGYFMASHHGFPPFRGYGAAIWTPVIAQHIALTNSQKWKDILDLYLKCNIGKTYSTSKTTSTTLLFISLWPALLEEAGIKELPGESIPEDIIRKRKEGGRRGLPLKPKKASSKKSSKKK